jgi:ABC-type sugar transport system substrate-binding protein
MLAIAVVAGGALAAGSSGAPNAKQTIGVVLPDPQTGAPLSREVLTGGTSAAAALGDRLVVIPADGPEAMSSAVKSLIAQHAAAIVVSTDQGPDTVKAVLPVLARARTAGIRTLSFEQRFPGSVWVSQTTPAQYAHALADALAAQTRGKGQYAIVPCRPAEAIVQTWLKAIESYVPRRYPGMSRVAIVYGDTGNGDADRNLVGKLIKRHPQLRGLINICPGESYILPQQVIQAHRVGKVFSAGNGGDCPPLYIDLVRFVRQGAEEIVCAGDPVNLGYLVVWAAGYLASGHAFVTRQYNVGGPVGTVSYHATNKELPLGRPLTITRANLAKYTG